MKNIKREAIVFNLHYDPNVPEEPVSERTPTFKNIHISNVTATNVKNACLFIGIDEMPIENLTFNNINIQAETGFVINKAKNIELHNVEVSVKKGASFIAQDVSGLVLDNVKSSNPLDDAPTIDLFNVKDAFIYNCFPMVPTQQFMKVDGKETKYVHLQNNLFYNVKVPVVKGAELKRNAVVM